MELSHSFTVPVSADQAFEVLTDIERIAPCMPGASIDSVDGEDFTGRVKVKVGPMQVTYRGKATYAEVDRENHSARIEARAQETRGSGTANATISASLKEVGPEETEVSVVSDLAITGRPAQFGRGVMNEVGAKLIGQFADCLSSKLAGGEEPEVDAAAEETQEIADVTARAGSNGRSAAVSEQEITQQVGAASPQPATGAGPAAAAAAPSAAAATSGATPAGATAGSPSTDTTPENRATTPRQTAPPEPEPIDLFDVAGASVAKRVGPIAAVAALLLLIILWRRRS